MAVNGETTAAGSQRISDQAHGRGAAVVVGEDDERDRVGPRADDRAGPGQLELSQAAVVKHCPQGALRFAQVLFQPLHPRRMAGSIAFLKFPWKISGANSVR